ncbi:GerMN domain-containing protein [Thermogemmatispora onikobensis]|uniref:GerMN domain-containing protein n=1 Tax=Thermogemmatispora onikobensis TaxID=732234 RepID=UPI0008530830|nr:GerMN domain-containing protein [Thermogemmatispora onikobensis]
MIRKIAKRRPTSARPLFLVLSVLSLALAVWLLPTSGAGHSQSQANAAPMVQGQLASTPSSGGYPIKVFFSRYPVSVTSDPTAVSPVERISPTLSVGTFALQMLIAGPTPSERSAGLFSELNTLLSGPSNCAAPLPVGGPDFTLTLNQRGSRSEPGTATVRFCRQLTSSGIGADARVQAEITATLTQFPGIRRVVILTRDGHCFGDESGLDRCLS